MCQILMGVFWVLFGVCAISGGILALNFGKPITEGKPEEVQKHPEVLKAYLGEDEGECAS